MGIRLFLCHNLIMSTHMYRDLRQFEQLTRSVPQSILSMARKSSFIVIADINGYLIALDK